MPGSCQFFSFPAAEESAAFGITTGADPDIVLGCGNPQGDGPLFFFVPVTGGAVRVPVCAMHGERLAYLYGPDGGGTGTQAQVITCPRCERTSHSRDDVREGYCGHCHDWTSPGSKGGRADGPLGH